MVLPLTAAAYSYSGPLLLWIFPVGSSVSTSDSLVLTPVLRLVAEAEQLSLHCISKRDGGGGGDTLYHGRCSSFLLHSAFPVFIGPISGGRSRTAHGDSEGAAAAAWTPLIRPRRPPSSGLLGVSVCGLLQLDLLLFKWCICKQLFIPPIVRFTLLKTPPQLGSVAFYSDMQQRSLLVSAFNLKCTIGGINPQACLHLSKPSHQLVFTQNSFHIV